MTLLLRLLLLVATALLPAIQDPSVQRARAAPHTPDRSAEPGSLNLAELAAAEQQQTVQGIHQALIALSELPAIKAKDAEGCNAYLAKIKQRYPGFISFIVVDINGSSFCDVTDDHKPSTAAGRTLLADVLRTGAFTVGEFAIGRQTGRNVLHMIFNSSTIGLAVLYLYIAPSPNPLLLMWDVIMPRIETNRIEYAG